MERNEYEGKLHSVLLKQFTEMYTRYKQAVKRLEELDNA